LIEQRKDHDELVAGIVKRLSEADDPNDIILDLCQKTGCIWSDAEALVHRVQEEEKFQITKKQMPLLTGMALFVFVTGLVLTGYGVYGIIVTLTAVGGASGPRDIYSYLMPMIEKRLDPVTAFEPAVFPYFNLMLGVLLSPVSALLFGAAMILGSLVGMRDAWETLLNRT
jgi:hypothetical protein